MQRGYSDTDILKILAGNVLRVAKATFPPDLAEAQSPRAWRAFSLPCSHCCQRGRKSAHVPAEAGPYSPGSAAAWLLDAHETIDLFQLDLLLSSVRPLDLD